MQQERVVGRDWKVEIGLACPRFKHLGWVVVVVVVDDEVNSYRNWLKSFGFGKSSSSSASLSSALWAMNFSGLNTISKRGSISSSCNSPSGSKMISKSEGIRSSSLFVLLQQHKNRLYEQKSLKLHNGGVVLSNFRKELR